MQWLPQFPVVLNLGEVVQVIGPVSASVLKRITVTNIYFIIIFSKLANCVSQLPSSLMT